MELGKDGFVRPLHKSMYLGARVGGSVMRNVLHATVDVPSRILRAVDGHELVAHRLENRLADEQTMIIDEIVERETDYPLVDMGVVNFVLVSAKHSPEMARRGREVTAPYIEEIEEIMTDRGVKELTVLKAVAKARHIMPEVVTRATHNPLWS